ncbi:coiled-coil domain-containing protein 12 [Brevipalpus obovatus]|uniref:coiled-coil domain-containing protein 12 n=1 Tax=Brevipalpus obovatus TaxID=246614 RepID=UPI003D9FA99D
MNVDDDDDSSVGKAEEEARKRRQKIISGQMWSKENSKQTSDEDAGKSGGESSSKAALPGPKFRSYIPHDERLAANKAEVGKPVQVEELIKDQLEAGKMESVAHSIDLENLAPKKIDWDLKRNISKKLNKLERRTKRAMAEIIRERIRKQSGDQVEIN